MGKKPNMLGGLLRAIGMVPVVLIALPAALVSSLVHAISEANRKRREDGNDFKEWVEAGAKMRHEQLLTAFEKPISNGQATYKVLPVGNINIRSGRVGVELAEDLNEMLECKHDWDPFDEAVPVGRHPIQLLITVEDTPHVIGIRVVFGDRQIVDLQPACNAFSRKFFWCERELPSVQPDLTTRYRRAQPEFVVALISPEAYAQIRSLESAVEHLEEFFPATKCEDPADYAKETKFADNSNMFFIGGYSPASKAFCYFGKSEDGMIQSLLIDFGAFGEPIRLPPYVRH